MGIKLKNKRIGILAGMGTMAGAHFFTEMIQECQRQGATNDDDFPEIVLYNLKPMGMSEKGIANESLFKKSLISGVKFLNNCKVSMIYIICNTAYIFYEFLQIHSIAKIIHIPRIVVKSLKDCNSIGIISSASTRKAGLYKKALWEYGIKSIEPNKKQQNAVDKVIGKLISGKYSDKDKSILENIIDNMFVFGAEKIILGCTELPILIQSVNNVIDAGKRAIKETLKL